MAQCNLTNDQLWTIYLCRVWGHKPYFFNKAKCKRCGVRLNES